MVLNFKVNTFDISREIRVVLNEFESMDDNDETSFIHHENNIENEDDEYEDDENEDEYSENEEELDDINVDTDDSEKCLNSKETLEAYKKDIAKYFDSAEVEIDEVNHMVYPLGHLKKEYMSESEIVSALVYNSEHMTIYDFLSETIISNYKTVEKYVNYLILNYFEENYNAKGDFLIDSLDELDKEDTVLFVMKEYPNIFFHLMECYEMSSVIGNASLIDRRRKTINEAGKSKEFYTKFRPDYFYDLELMDISEKYSFHKDYCMEEESFLIVLRCLGKVNVNNVHAAINSICLEGRWALMKKLVDCFNEFTCGKKEYAKLTANERYLTDIFAYTGNINNLVMSNDNYLMTVVNGYLSNTDSYLSKKFEHEFETDHLAFQYNKTKKGKK